MINKFSELTTDFEKDEIILGIDEAGRGPVLGPMVYACCYWKRENESEIKKHLKFADSKTLSETKREKIFEEMKDYSNLLRFKEKIILPETLSNKQLKRNKISLNEISTDAACELIQQALDENNNIKEVFVDTVGPPKSYQELLSRRFHNYDIKFTVAPKADSLYPCVSAASIVAKVTRDRFIANWTFDENEKYEENKKDFSFKFGSGYPGDPVSKKWLVENFDPVFGYPNIVRFSWKTVTNSLKNNKAYDVKWY